MHSVMKPIVWNDAGYRHPTGGPFSGGFPHEEGYGHEEWNHRPELIVEWDGRPMRVFHTENISHRDIVLDGQPITVHLYASRNGRQAIMSTARNCISLHSRDEDRLEILRRVPLINGLWREAWQLPFVQHKHRDPSTFKKRWLESDAPWFPTWLCPVEDLFDWDLPIDVDGREIKGSRFITRYTISELLTEEQAASIETLLPYPDDAKREVDADVSVVEARGLDATTKKRLVDARRGQGRFREDLVSLWGGSCAVTACTLGPVLRASHIKAWRVSSDAERLDPNNGILLSANFDALFDRHLISFDDHGFMLVSKRISEKQRAILSLNRQLRISVRPEMLKYLKSHRDKFEADERRN